MSISATAAASIAVKTSSSSPSRSCKFAHFSSLRLPTELRVSSLRSHNLGTNPRRQALTLVAAKQQTYSSFDDLLQKSDKPVLVDFYATWCGPCQFMGPILDQVSGKLIDKIQVVKIDTEKYPSIANKYKIEALPTFILFKDGEPYDRFVSDMMRAHWVLSSLSNALRLHCKLRSSRISGDNHVPSHVVKMADSRV
ncbi:thioredoxin family protein [Striga asiatica]|uniref:Thioredoxin family protein n=1 Tax=Striga asiatica TaxID=4170 RepID=A0A5A7PXP7_STRAF|nr:thioredoxin family protein [Striga asiatica]